MNQINENIKQHLKYATAALFDLDDAGCTCLGVEIRNRLPVVKVDRLPPDARAAVSVVRRHAGVREAVRVTSLRGVQIECIEQYA